VATTRRLAAIVFTDVVGFTAATQADEAATLGRLREQEGLVRPIIAAYGGREVKSTGDGFLIEFGSALKATECAAEILSRLRARNSTAHGAPIELRIGIHVGDVEQHDGDIFGDAVNVASRIVSIAEPGGVCLTGQVYDHVRGRVPYPLERLEPRPLKGIRDPIDVYNLVLPWMERQPPPTPDGTGGAKSLAVLPFANISPDPADSYFADGLTEELITVLAQIAGLRVIARTSVQTYRSTPKSAVQIGRELRVSTVLEGSVRMAGNRIRVTVQLIDAPSEGHLWARTFDRELDDIFAVQSEIAKQVAEALTVKLRPAEEARLDSPPIVSSESYLAYLRGHTLMHRPTQGALESARNEFTHAIELDPRNAAALSGLADATRFLGWWHSSSSRAEWEVPSRRFAERAIELDPHLAEAHASLALAHADASSAGESDEWAAALQEFRLAVALNPSYSAAHQWYAIYLEILGRPGEAVVELRLAQAADPLWKTNVALLALLLTWIGRYGEAEAELDRLRELDAGGERYQYARLAYLSQRGDTPELRAQLQSLIALESDSRDKAKLIARQLALTGHSADAVKLLRQEELLPERGYSYSQLARVYAYVGDLDGCFRFLERSIASNRLEIHGFILDPLLEPVRRDPRFAPLLRRMFLA
jgi:adenylate cyclase